MKTVSNRVQTGTKTHVVMEPLEDRRLMSTTIAFFDDPKFVNTASGSDANDLLQQIQAYGTYTVKTFVGTTAAAFTAGLSGANLLVIPALDEGNLNSALTNLTRTAIVNFLSDGGGLLLTGDPSNRETGFLDNTFSWQLYGGAAGHSSFSLDQSSGTKFSGGPTTINANANNYELGGLFTGAKPVYDSNVTAYGAAVVLLPVGAADPIVYLTWDWSNGGPNGTLNGGWNTVLDEAIQQVAGKPQVTPAPTSLTATPLNQTTINLSWKGSTTNVTGFTVQQAKTKTGPWTTIGTTAVGVTTFAATKLTASTAYYYQVYATGPLGNSSPDTLSSPTTTFSSVFATLTAGKLSVTGTNDNDSIYLTLSGSTLTATETNTGDTLKLTFSDTAVKSITITDTTGNNTIAVGAGIIAASITTGSGNDTFIMLNTAADSVNGGGGADVLFGTVKDVVKNVKTVVT